MRAYTHELVRRFRTDFHGAYRMMRDTDHCDESTGTFGRWHAEGDVWTHTMMVVSHVMACDMTYLRGRCLIMAALLHDVGKVFTREVQEERDRVTFYGHPGMSTFLAADMIRELDSEMSEEDVLFTLQLINRHQVLFAVTDDMSTRARTRLMRRYDYDGGAELLQHIDFLRRADYAGNISAKEDRVGHQVVYDIIFELRQRYGTEDE